MECRTVPHRLWRRRGRGRWMERRSRFRWPSRRTTFSAHPPALNPVPRCLPSLRCQRNQPCAVWKSCTGNSRRLDPPLPPGGAQTPRPCRHQTHIPSHGPEPQCRTRVNQDPAWSMVGALSPALQFRSPEANLHLQTEPRKRQGQQSLRGWPWSRRSPRRSQLPLHQAMARRPHQGLQKRTKREKRKGRPEASWAGTLRRTPNPITPLRRRRKRRNLSCHRACQSKSRVRLRLPPRLLTRGMASPPPAAPRQRNGRHQGPPMPPHLLSIPSPGSPTRSRLPPLHLLPPAWRASHPSV